MPLDLAQFQTDLTAATSAFATCTSDLATAPATIGTLEAQLAALITDSDGDGKRDLDDACPGTAAAAPVDVAGCSAAQFCAQIDATTRTGKRACKRSDWMNDEPVMRGRERHCTIDSGGPGTADGGCVPIN